MKLWGCMSSPREEWTEGREGPRAEPQRSSGEDRLSTVTEKEWPERQVEDKENVLS